MQDWLDLLRQTVETHGWAVQFVESIRSPFAYTIGLHPQGLPELLVTGLTPQRATLTLNSVADYLVNGGRPVPGDFITLGAEVELAVVQVDHPEAHLNMAMALYGKDVKALQLVWADAQGHRPWCPEFSNGGLRQPVFGVRPDLSDGFATS
ncbi:DUF4262 domain-containing protein [Mycobacterium paraterrae]|uniref:DUF4262 domain-containing protein n=1 Tax=Mycobacterium paraterrae TaxID=577492 RepID=A0ABY3VLH6_9MYCO|nr:DUF4262 domain-containing protein [Mycobacterium paraterrae]UMB68057.1 DUF4262 domain-containing protein [Mycobacterium paraterrae]